MSPYFAAGFTSWAADTANPASEIKQAAAVTSRLNLDDLKDQDKLQHLIERFTDMWDITEGTTDSPILTLFSSSSASALSDNLLATITSLKHGGF